MDEFDDERFARGAEALLAATSRPGGEATDASAGTTSARAAARVIRRDGDREELLCAASGCSAVIRVVARSETGRHQLRREVELLAALEVGGIAAAPTVLEVEDEGYVREDATPLGTRRGRRCAEEATPATGERQAQARARTALDSLIDALHDHGWVLGAPAGEGLGMRSDGSVTVLDLSGLRPEEGTGARLEDRLWVDSVLRDEGRTLRRRIDTHASSASPPHEPQVDDDPADEEAPSVRPLPAPRSLAPPARARQSGARRPQSRRLRALGALHRLGDELRAPGLRRLALLSAVAVLIGGGVMGSGMWWFAAEAPPSARTAPTDDSESPPPDEAGAPRIADPLSLAADLATARHDYVTGASNAPVAAPGSPAEAADEQVRRAYEGTTVEDAEPEVLTARVVGEPTPEGTARLEVQTTTPAHTVIEADGTTRSAPATGPVTIDLELRWSTGTWWVVEVLQPR